MNGGRKWKAPTLAGVLIAATAAAVSTLVLAQTQSSELRSPSAFAQIGDRKARSAAIFTEMGKVIQHPRCLNCHPRNDRPTQGAGRPHTPPVQRGPAGIGVSGMECTTCHGPANVKFANGQGSIPGHPTWHLAPKEAGWQGLSLGAICKQLKDPRRNGGMSLAELQHHNAEDSLVGWGWQPGLGREPAPGTQKLFGELTQAWIEAGATCPKR